MSRNARIVVMASLATSTFAALFAASAPASAATLTLTSGQPFDRNAPANLIKNGSFEDQPVGFYWATGTTFTTYAPVPSWTSAGGPQNYAFVYNSPGFQNHGQNSLYFGNQFLQYPGQSGSNPSPVPTYDFTTGEVTFRTPPTFTPRPDYAIPVTLEQTVTGLDTTATYLFRFWTTGEGVGKNAGASAGYGYDGIFGLDVTGFSTVYLAVPDGGPNPTVGIEKEYQFLLQPASSTTTFKFTNWGHAYVNVNGTATPTTELILDDVSLNVIPEPSALAFLAPATLILARRRK